VSGASCAEVSDALAVVTAIALQRDAELVAAPSAAPVPAPVQPALAAPPLPAESASAPPLELVMGRKDLLVPAGKLVLDHLSTYTLGAGVQLGAIPGVVLPRLDFNLSRTNTVTTPDARAFMLGNELRIRWTLLGLAQHRASGHETSLFGIKAAVGGCTPLFQPTALRLKLCSEIAAGGMEVETRAAATGWRKAEMQALATAGTELDLHYDLSRLFHLDVRAGGELWLSRIRAEREDGSRLFESRLFNAHVMVGFGIHF
jgi:hypothetical protein